MSSGADQMGYWAKNTCGSSYFFSNALASFIEKMFHVLFYLSNNYRVRGSKTFKNAAAWV
jgi:hypothetical protein